MFTSYLHAENKMRTPSPGRQEKQKDQSWKTFTSTESGFTARFPTLPEHMQQKISIPRTDITIEYDTYMSEPSDNAVYVISVWNYPPIVDMSKPEVNLQDGFKGMLAALPGSEVMKMNMTETEGFKTLEFLVKNEDIFFQGKLILVYNTLYQVFVVYKDSKEMPGHYKRFIDSFKLLSPEKRRVFDEKEDKRHPKMNVRL